MLILKEEIYAPFFSFNLLAPFFFLRLPYIRTVLLNMNTYYGTLETMFLRPKNVKLVDSVLPHLDWAAGGVTTSDAKQKEF